MRKRRAWVVDSDIFSMIMMGFLFGRRKKSKRPYIPMAMQSSWNEEDVAGSNEGIRSQKGDYGLRHQVLQKATPLCIFNRRRRRRGGGGGGGRRRFNPAATNNDHYRSSPPPLYYILSEADPEEEENTMDNMPSFIPMDKTRERNYSKAWRRYITSIRRFIQRIPGLHKCNSTVLVGDELEETEYLGKENITFEAGNGDGSSNNSSSSDGGGGILLPTFDDSTSLFEISSTSDCSASPLMMIQRRSYGEYPVQSRRNKRIDLLQQRSQEGDENDDESSTLRAIKDSTTSIADPYYFKGAQLILRALSSDDSDTSRSSLLGIAFPHPVVVSEEGLSNSSRERRLGIQTGHPSWSNRREEENPIPVERSVFSISPYSAVPGPLAHEEDDFWDSYHDDKDNSDEQKSVCTSISKDVETEKPQVRIYALPSKEQYGDDTMSTHLLWGRQQQRPQETDDRKPDERTKSRATSFIPERLTKEVIEPIYAFARELSSCGHALDDNGFFDEEVPFDELAVDRERNNARYRIKRIAQKRFKSTSLTKPLQL